LLFKVDRVNSESDHAERGVQGTESLQTIGCVTIIMRQEDSKDKCFS
jgi:hypothetical protein